jgi:hypothetical protein
MNRAERRRQQSAALKSGSLQVVHLPPDVASIYEQIHAPNLTGALTIKCPYCKCLNTEGMKICCDSMRDAMITIRDATPVPVVVN